MDQHRTPYQSTKQAPTIASTNLRALVTTAMPPSAPPIDPAIRVANEHHGRAGRR